MSQDIDLCSTLVRQRKIFLGVFLILGLAGLTAGLLRPERFTYSTSIEIGQRVTETNAALIESPPTVVAKLNESFIAAARADYRKRNPEDRALYRVIARIPKGSNIVVIEGVGPAAAEDAYVNILRDAVAAIRRDHARISDLRQSLLEVELDRARLALNEANLMLEDLREQTELTKSDLQRLDETERLLVKQIDQLEKQIASSLLYRTQALAETTSQPQAMTLLLLDGQIENDRTRLAQLENQRYVELKSTRERLRKTLADNRRLQEAQRQTIIVREQELKTSELGKLAVIETRALSAPMRSQMPVGPGKPVVAVLALLLAFGLGLLAAFAAALMAKVRASVLNS